MKYLSCLCLALVIAINASSAALIEDAVVYDVTNISEGNAEIFWGFNGSPINAPEVHLVFAKLIDIKCPSGQIIKALKEYEVLVSNDCGEELFSGRPQFQDSSPIYFSVISKEHPGLSGVYEIVLADRIKWEILRGDIAGYNGEEVNVTVEIKGSFLVSGPHSGRLKPVVDTLAVLRFNGSIQNGNLMIESIHPGQKALTHEKIRPYPIVLPLGE